MVDFDVSSNHLSQLDRRTRVGASIRSRVVVIDAYGRDRTLLPETVKRRCPAEEPSPRRGLHLLQGS